MEHTREYWEEEYAKAAALPVQEQAAAYAELLERMNRALDPQWEAQRVEITGLPVLGSGLTFGALCQQEQRDWRTGEPIRG